MGEFNQLLTILFEILGITAFIMIIILGIKTYKILNDIGLTIGELYDLRNKIVQEMEEKNDV